MDNEEENLPKSRYQQVQYPNDPEVERALRKLRSTGIKKGWWVLQAIRERLIREGKLVEKGA